jgi:hypothetical protein
MAGICENGHRSATDDYCDVCGLPVRPLPATAPPAGAPPKPASQKCPNCGATNPADALFCEACGYDYTTGTLPRSDAAGMLGLRRPGATPAPVTVPASAGVLDIDAPVPSPAPAPSALVPPAVEEPVAVEEPAPAVPATPSYVPAQPSPAALAASPTEPAPADEPAADPLVAPEPTPIEATDTPAAPEEAPAEAAAPESGPLETEEPTRGRPAPRRESYVAEIWIDPDWYEVQETDEPMPSVGLPTTVVLRADNLVGRVSESRNIHPEVDCGIDSGVSRRQSRLSTDGTRWYVEDLGSANGTFVGPAAGPLPVSPITGRYELGPDDRVYVGAWTRIVVRKASKEEIDALS